MYFRKFFLVFFLMLAAPWVAYGEDNENNAVSMAEYNALKGKVADNIKRSDRRRGYTIRAGRELGERLFNISQTLGRIEGQGEEQNKAVLSILDRMREDGAAMGTRINSHGQRLSAVEERSKNNRWLIGICITCAATLAAKRIRAKKKKSSLMILPK